jgi:hypothetical protein
MHDGPGDPQAMGVDLPPRSVFEPPSYPNVWFYVHERLASSQSDAVRLVTEWLRDHCGIKNDFSGFKPPEACDLQARLGGLQPWQGAPGQARNHAHDLHIRFYFVALRQQQQERVVVDPHGGGAAWYYRFAGSVHYEVADEHPLHPYVDECPFCGRTGEYAQAADLFAGAHEPLGLELLLDGTNHGRPVARPDGRQVGGISAMRDHYDVRINRLRPYRPDMNIVALAVVFIGPKT